ncbi:MAG: hypothetical protein PHI27_02340 [Eubacteriales bacterium]|nr:hypothetical protein [Eubacteriales bacterium]MDD3881073.1 hypothetical protein [Eubacteriales bacterium]MDD4511858.1 hypothetical protein [Eubacteriales bacterium]
MRKARKAAAALLVSLTLTVTGASADILPLITKQPVPDGATDYGEISQRIQLDAMQSESYTAVIPEDLKEFFYYAQNDSIWNRMIFESQGSGKYRPFGDGACAPTSLSIVLVNLVKPEKLTDLLSAGKNDFTFCTCSINPLFHKGSHEMYKVENEEQLKRYLPVIVGNYATGNNKSGTKFRWNGFGVKSALFQSLADVFSLEYKITQDKSVLEYAIANGGMAITLSKYSPLTSSSHYLVIADIVDEYVYLLDPYLRADREYKLSSTTYFEQVSPGLIKIKQSQMENVFHLLTYYVFLPDGVSFDKDAPATMSDEEIKKAEEAEGQE